MEAGNDDAVESVTTALDLHHIGTWESFHRTDWADQMKEPPSLLILYLELVKKYLTIQKPSAGIGLPCRPPEELENFDLRFLG